MTFILTFLGKGGVGRTTVAIATAKRFARDGQRVLLAEQHPGPDLGLALGASLSCEPQEIEPNFSVVQFQTTVLLERSWNELKGLESQYLKTPFFKEVFGQELGVLPGIDNALALNAIRQYSDSGHYDVIVYDSTGDVSMLRTLGMPEVMSWYIRRFRQVFLESDLGKTLSPFAQPIASAILNVNWSGNDILAEPTNQVSSLLDRGRETVSDPNQMLAYLVTTQQPGAIATARYLWGSAQQIGLTVGGVILNQANVTEDLIKTFAPLPLTSLPVLADNQWLPLMNALPSFKPSIEVPLPITVNLAERTVMLFLPGFTKQDVKLTQYGPEVTVEAGDQRRNIFLPPELQGKPVTGAKFQDSCLIITFGA
jgi:arsenite-transporting ATPase